MAKYLAGRSSVRAGLYWLLFYGLLWLLLSGGGGWAFALPSVILASLLTLYLQLQPWYLRPWRLPAALYTVLRYAITGALEVTPFALRRTQRQGWLQHPLRNDDPRSRLLLATVVSLIPGAIAVKADREVLHLHVLDSSVSWPARVTELENQIARLLYPLGETVLDRLH